MVIDWNQSSIDFYTNVFGAKPLEGWTLYRLAGKDSLLAAGA